MASSITLPEGCIIPPGVTKNDLTQALSEFTTLLGEENIDLVDSTKLDGRNGYHDPAKSHDSFAILPEDELVASAVLSPGSTDEVVAIVKIANKFKIPIWPVSRGRNFGYGASAPRVRGSCVVDLGKRMNKILEIDEENAWCRVEPGVSYQMLYDELQRRGSKLWVDVPDLGGGSLIGNAVERGGGYTPYQDHFMTHSGMEVVLPTGSVIRTGCGAMPDKNNHNGSSTMWSVFPYGYGPYHDGIFTQSNFGIVTNMGVMLMPDPGGYQFYQISFEHEEDIGQVIDLMLPLKISGAVMAGVTIRPTILDLAVSHPRAHYSASGNALTEEEIENARSKTHLGKWSLYGAAYGPKEMRDSQIDLMKGVFLQIKGAKFYTPEDVPKKDNYTVLHIRDETLRGIPSTWELKWTDFVPNGSCGFVSPFAPGASKEALKSYQISKKLFKEYNFDLFGTWVVVPRGISWLSIVVYDKSKTAERTRAFELMQRLAAENANLGFGMYRSHVAMMDQVADTYRWGDDRFGGSLMAMNEVLKDALDPNGILAPGKSGIWPKAYRDGSIILEQSQPVPHMSLKNKL